MKIKPGENLTDGKFYRRKIPDLRYKFCNVLKYLWVSPYIGLLQLASMAIKCWKILQLCDVAIFPIQFQILDYI